MVKNGPNDWINLKYMGKLSDYHYCRNYYNISLLSDGKFNTNF